MRRPENLYSRGERGDESNASWDGKEDAGITFDLPLLLF